MRVELSKFQELVVKSFTLSENGRDCDFEKSFKKFKELEKKQKEK